MVTYKIYEDQLEPQAQRCLYAETAHDTACELHT